MPPEIDIPKTNWSLLAFAVIEFGFDWTVTLLFDKVKLKYEISKSPVPSIELHTDSLNVIVKLELLLSITMLVISGGELS